jgi:hypothetical protein
MATKRKLSQDSGQRSLAHAPRGRIAIAPHARFDLPQGLGPWGILVVESPFAGLARERRSFCKVWLIR